MEITQETEGYMTTRNGHPDISGIVLTVKHPDRIRIDGLSMNGKILNGGFYLNKNDFIKLCKNFLETEEIQ